MCGRYTLTVEEEQLRERFRHQISVFEHTPRFNIAPSQNVPVIYNRDDKRVFTGLRWGLIPFWAKDEKIGYKMINARVETTAEKPSYKKVFTII